MNKQTLNYLSFLGLIICVLMLFRTESEKQKEFEAYKIEQKLSLKNILKKDSINIAIEQLYRLKMNIKIDSIRSSQKAISKKTAIFERKNEKFQQEIININNLIGDLPNF